MYTLGAFCVLLVNHVLFLLLRVEPKYAGHILASVAIVRSRPDCNDILVLEKLLISLLD